MPNKTPLTNARVQAIRIRKTEFIVWDSKLSGFGLRVRPNGSKRLIYFCNGKKITLSASSVDEARKECMKILSDNNKGSSSKRMTLGDYIENEWKTRYYIILADETKRGVKYTMNIHLLPNFGHMHLHEINKQDILKWFEKCSVRTPRMANRSLSTLRQILNMAKRDMLIASNPAWGIKHNPRPGMMRFLTDAERMTLLATLARREKKYPNLRAGCDIIRLLLLTGCRKSEITGLEWAWIRDGQIHLPKGKTGGRVVWMGDEAEAIIARQPKTNSKFVFPDLKDPTCRHPFDSQFWWTTRRMAGLEDVRLHDLRHSFASHAIRQGVSLPMIAKLLGHRRLQTTLRYAHVSDADVEAAAERVGARIAGLLGEQP